MSEYGGVESENIERYEVRISSVNISVLIVSTWLELKCQMSTFQHRKLLELSSYDCELFQFEDI